MLCDDKTAISIAKNHVHHDQTKQLTAVCQIYGEQMTVETLPISLRFLS